MAHLYIVERQRLTELIGDDMPYQYMYIGNMPAVVIAIMDDVCYIHSATYINDDRFVLVAEDVNDEESWGLIPEEHKQAIMGSIPADDTDGDDQTVRVFCPHAWM